VNASSSNPKQAASTKPVADFLTAVKAALDSGADPGLISTYVGHAAEQPSAGVLRMLASLMTAEVKRAGNGGQK
jgi:hypothetical protein